MESTLFDDQINDITSRVASIFAELDGLPLDSKVDAINRIKTELAGHSPFSSEPVDCVIWVKAEDVKGNNYNPNTVAPPEMRLLEKSILADGYTQPIVAYAEEERFTVIDGFHRSRVGKESKKVRDRVRGYLPVTLVGKDRTDIKDRMAATIRHNRARGVHGVVPMIDIVSSLIREGFTDEEVCKEIGMDADELLRFKQNSGLPELFRGHQYSKSWT